MPNPVIETFKESSIKQKPIANTVSRMFFCSNSFNFENKTLLTLKTDLDCKIDLKGDFHEILDHCLLKDSTWAPYEQEKTVSQTFSFAQRYSITTFENRVSS